MRALPHDSLHLNAFIYERLITFLHVRIRLAHLVWKLLLVGQSPKRITEVQKRRTSLAEFGLNGFSIFLRTVLNEELKLGPVDLSAKKAHSFAFGSHSETEDAASPGK